MLRIDEPEELYRFAHEAMATELTVSMGGVDRDYARQAAQEVFNRVDDVETKLSLYREDSDVSRINVSTLGDQVRVSEDCALCLTEAMQASAMTQNRFHAFLGIESLRRKGNVPNYLRKLVGAGADDDSEGASIEMDARSRFVRKVKEGVILDLGGVGKGYALDTAVEILEDWEIPATILSFGGSTVLLHAFESQPCWRGALGETPLAPFRKGAISSSGLGFQGDHIVDPSLASLSSLWVRSFSRCRRAAMADALSTGAMLMPEADLKRTMKDSPGVSLAVETPEGLKLEESFCAWIEEGS